MFRLFLRKKILSAGDKAAKALSAQAGKVGKAGKAGAAKGGKKKAAEPEPPIRNRRVFARYNIDHKHLTLMNDQDILLVREISSKGFSTEVSPRGFARLVVGDVYDARVSDVGHPYIVMKFYGRGTLGDRVRSGGVWTAKGQSFDATGVNGGTTYTISAFAICST